MISTKGLKIAIDECNHLIIALCVVAYGAFSVRPNKFDESEIRTLVRCKMEQYGAIPGDNYTIIERMLTVCAFRSAHLKDVLVLVSMAVRINMEMTSILPKVRQKHFVIDLTYNLNP